MTARTCPVHGEYSATGVCRWCEDRFAVDVSAITGREVSGIGEPWEWTAEAVILSDPKPRWHLPARTLIANTPAPALATAHAALRWERVAQRWNYKHAGSITAVYLDWQRCIDEMTKRMRRVFALPEMPP